MAELTLVPDLALDHPRSRLRTSMCVAVAAIAILNLADLITTHAALALSGGMESNPLSALLISTGMVGVIKAAVIVALIIRIPRQRPTVGLHAILWFVAGFYGLTVLSNLLVIQRLS